MIERELTKVVGLKYESGEGLPTVMLKGIGPLASELLKEGRAVGAPIIHDADLVEKLLRLPMDSEIGPDLFRVVAIILAHVFALNGKMEERQRG